MVYDIFGGAISWKGAVILSSAVANLDFRVTIFIDEFVVVGFDDGADVVHATVADFDGVPVADFV